MRARPVSAEPAALGTGPPRASFTRARVERILGVVVGAACIVFWLQALLAAIGSDDLHRWHAPVAIVVFVSLSVMVATSISGLLARWGAGQFAVVFIAVLALWPLLASVDATDRGPQPWIWYLLNVATIAAVLAFPMPLQITWAILVPIGYGVLRVLVGAAEVDNGWALIIADVSFAVIFAFVLLMLGWMFRSVAAAVDDARAAALTSYAVAAEAEATERERLEMAALMHDSVLSALIAAARADTPRQRELAVMMAREALTGLADAESENASSTDDAISTAQIVLDIEDAATAAFGLRLFIPPPADVPIPGEVARAITLAATQAVANAVQHAEARGLAVTVTAAGGGCVVTVRDSGRGMDVDGVPDDRLGIRASIFARMSAVGGSAHIDSGPGGTVVTIGWTP